MFGLRRTAISGVRAINRFGSHAAASSVYTADPVFQSYFLGRSVDLKQVESLYPDLNKTAGPKSISFTTADSMSGFDVYQYGSVVFYNLSPAAHQENLAKLNELELSPADASNMIEGYDFNCQARVENPSNETHLLDDGQKKKLSEAKALAPTLDTYRPAGSALAQVVAMDYVDVALDRIIENISNLDEAGLNSAVKHLTGVMESIDGRTSPKFNNDTHTLAYKEMRKQSGLDALYSELDFKLAVLTKQYNIALK